MTIKINTYEMTALLCVDSDQAMQDALFAFLATRTRTYCARCGAMLGETEVTICKSCLADVLVSLATMEKLKERE